MRRGAKNIARSSYYFVAMNCLFRGSRCVRLLASRCGFSTSESSAPSAVCAQNLISRWQTEPNNRRRYHPITTATRKFSSLNVNTDAAERSDGQEESIIITTPQRSPSALEQANMDEITPGHALFVLQKYAAKTEGKRIRQLDFVTLCESARPGKKRDAKVIATALKEFKRNNYFVIQTPSASVAIEGMLRSIIPTWKVSDGKPRVQGAAFVSEQIVDENSGLYFAAETEAVDKVLEELHKGLLEMKENGINLRIDNIGKAVEEGEAEEEEPSPDEKILRDALRATEDVVTLLIKRKSRPETKMTKRARAKYRKFIQVKSGPKTRTLELATKIAISIGGSAVAQEKIITPYLDAWFSKEINKDILQLIEDAAKEEMEQQTAIKAAADSDEAEEGEGVVELEAAASDAAKGEEDEDAATEGGVIEEEASNSTADGADIDGDGVVSQNDSEPEGEEEEKKD